MDSELGFAIDIQASIKRNITTLMAEAMSARNVLRRNQVREWMAGAIETGHDSTEAHSQIKISSFEPANVHKPAVWERYLNEVAIRSPEFADRFYGRSKLLIAMNSACGLMFDIKHALEGHNPVNDLRSFAYGVLEPALLTPTSFGDEILFRLHEPEYNRILSQSSDLYRSLTRAQEVGETGDIIAGAHLVLAADLVYSPVRPLKDFKTETYSLELIEGLADDVEAASTHVASATAFGARFASALNAFGEYALMPATRNSVFVQATQATHRLGVQQLEHLSTEIAGKLHEKLTVRDLRPVDGEQRISALINKNAAEIVSGANRSFEL